jgi:hypothetical protein
MRMMLPLLLAASASAAPLTLRSGPARAHLIELYSSEGCSSCPPADAWLRALRGSGRLWKDFVPVAFHVAYWDYLGWKDPLADPANEARQRAYAGSWGADGGGVYTPGVVLDGAEWTGWRGGAPAPGGESGVLTVSVAGGRAEARFETKEAGPFSFYVARLGSGIDSAVRRGENGGATLRHDFVVRGLRAASMEEKGGVWTARLPLPPAASPAGRPGLAAWVAGPDGRPVQAAGADLRAD